MANKKLFRSASDKRIAGVCGGLAEYFDTDSTFIRVLFLIFLFVIGGGFLAYLICWIAMPSEY